MSSGPVVVLALEKEHDAIASWRKLMGAQSGQRRSRHDPQAFRRKH